MNAKQIEVSAPPTGWAITTMIGPGIVWASLAIGGGELVLIPRVGAIYGAVFFWMPMLAIALKYFMLNEIGRWSVATGHTVYDGLALLPGPRKWLNWIILVVSVYLGAVHIGGLVAMIGVITSNLLPFFPPYVWSILMMLSYIALTWTRKYSLLEIVMMVVVGVLTVTTVIIGLSAFPGLNDLVTGFSFKLPAATPEWAVAKYKISQNPMVEILPAMAFAGCGAINSLWYTDWALSKGLGLGQHFDGLEGSRVALDDLKRLPQGTIERIRGWYRVMFHDSLWGANFLTILVTFFYLTLAVAVLHPLKEAPGGLGFIATLSKTFTATLGPWAKWLYLVGAFGVIYGTMATIYDGYARIINKSITICLPNWQAYKKIAPVWRYRIWVLYGTLANFILVYWLNALPVQFLQAAAWIEGTFLLPVMACAIAYLTAKILPGLYPEGGRDLIKPKPIFTLGCLAAGALYAVLIVYMIIW